MRILLVIFCLVLTAPAFSEDMRTIHVFVALCDNENQGIVPVPAKIGNGQDPFNNLYWGCGYGVKNYFHKKSGNWTLLKTIKNPKTDILERIVFKHKTKNVYLLADAYDGRAIKQCTIDFLEASSGDFTTTITIDDKTIAFGGSSSLVAYCGHNGLMDFSIDPDLTPKNDDKRDAIVVACVSKAYFKSYMQASGANPLVWSMGLMSAEAYTLSWAVDGWVLNETDAQIRERAAQAYNHYQKCGINGARRLLVTGY